MKMKKYFSVIYVFFLLINYTTNVFASEPTNDSQVQLLLLQNIKSRLPLKLDANTTLVDVSITNEMLDFMHEIKDIPVDKFNDPRREKIVHDFSVIKYCEREPNDAMLKAFFQKGFNYIYYIGDKQVLNIHVDKSDCETN